MGTAIVQWRHLLGKIVLDLMWCHMWHCSSIATSVVTHHRSRACPIEDWSVDRSTFSGLTDEKMALKMWTGLLLDTLHMWCHGRSHMTSHGQFDTRWQHCGQLGIVTNFNFVRFLLCSF